MDTGAPAFVRIQGVDLYDLACPATDSTEILAKWKTGIAAHGEERSRRMGLLVEWPDRAIPAQVERATEASNPASPKSP